MPNQLNISRRDRVLIQTLSDNIEHLAKQIDELNQTLSDREDKG